MQNTICVSVFDLLQFLIRKCIKKLRHALKGGIDPNYFAKLICHRGKWSNHGAKPIADLLCSKIDRATLEIETFSFKTDLQYFKSYLSCF